MTRKFTYKVPDEAKNFVIVQHDLDTRDIVWSAYTEEGGEIIGAVEVLDANRIRLCIPAIMFFHPTRVHTLIGVTP